MAVAFRTQTSRSYPAQRTPRDAQQPSSRTVTRMESVLRSWTGRYGWLATDRPTLWLAGGLAV